MNRFFSTEYLGQFIPKRVAKSKIEPVQQDSVQRHEDGPKPELLRRKMPRQDAGEDQTHDERYPGGPHQGKGAHPYPMRSPFFLIGDIWLQEKPLDQKQGTERWRFLSPETGKRVGKPHLRCFLRQQIQINKLRSSAKYTHRHPHNGPSASP